MKMIISKEELNDLREKYPVGCRVKLTKMDDIQAPPLGTKGTVRGIDDIGSIMVSWDTGSSLSVAYGDDTCVRIRTCPKCKKEYEGYPAISRKDGKTELCARCGNIESMEIVGMPQKEIDKVMNKIDAIEKEIKNG